MEIKLTEQVLPGSLPMPEQHKTETAALAFVKLVAAAGEEVSQLREDGTAPAGVTQPAVAPEAGVSAPADMLAGSLWQALKKPPDDNEPGEETPPPNEKVVRKPQVKKYPKQWK
jgi:hypothetical protein